MSQVPGDEPPPPEEELDAARKAAETRLKNVQGRPGMEESTMEAQDNLSRERARSTLFKNTGCLVAGGLAIVLVAALFTVKLLSSDDKCDGAPARHDGITLISCVNTTNGVDNPAQQENSASSTESTDSSSSSSGAAGGGTASVPPPDASSLPKGAILLQGQTGDNIGPIAQDGLNRFVSLTAPGVSTNGNSVAITWDKGAGKVISFGSNLHTSTNKGRYGFALFRNVAATPPTTSPSGEAESQYRAGCAIEVGQTSCSSITAGAPIANGDKVTIIIGEAGTGVGDYSADWWFVFQPD